MRISRLFAAISILAAMITVSASAQTRRGTAASKPKPTSPAATDTKQMSMAFVDTGVFGDEKTGITRYVNAVKGLDREFRPRQTELDGMQTRLKGIVDEITKMRANPPMDLTAIAAKQTEGETLQRDIKARKDQADVDLSKRYQEVVGPISTDIGKALDRFAAQRGIGVIFDVSKLAQAILTINPATDMTQAFILEYNATHPATASH
jgi:Skp family chaperone for outer membrane proteins